MVSDRPPVVVPTIARALASVMAEVRKVTKTDVNTQQNYKFRGVDRVINAVAQPLREHGVIVLPHLVEERLETFQTTKGSTMYRSIVTVDYRFIGPAGDELVATVAGEGSDSLDKATSKAMSVAYRTALIQALCLPTGDPDPDSFSPPDSAPKTKLQQAKAKVWELAQKADMDVDALAREFTAVFDKAIGEASTSQLEQFAKHLSVGDDEEKPARTSIQRTQRPAPVKTGPPPTPPEPEFEPSGMDEFAPVDLLTAAQSKHLHALFNDVGLTVREDRLTFTSNFIGHDIATSNDLTKAEASRLIEFLLARPRDATAEDMQAYLDKVT